MIKLIHLLTELLEAQSQSATRKIRDAIVASNPETLRVAPKIDRVYAPTISSDAFKKIVEDLYGTSVTEILPKAVGSKSSQFSTFVFNVDGSDMSIVLAKGIVRGAEGENKEVGSIQEKLDSIGGDEGVTIMIGDIPYKGIKTIQKIPGNKKADFELSGGSKSIFVQHKSPTHQQMAGIARPPYSTDEEVKTFVEDVRNQVAANGKLTEPFVRAIESSELKQLATYGTTNGTFDANTVQLYCVGELDLVPAEEKGAYKLIGKQKTYEYPTIPDGDDTPMLGATYRKDRNQSGIKDVRMGIYPEGYLARKTVTESIISLIDLFEVEMQPSERAKMKNFLYRGTEDQIAQAASEFIMPPNRAIRPSDRSGVIEGGMLQTDHPENKERTVGWGWDEPNTLEEMQDIVRDALFGRELQVLEEVKKIIDRLKQKGYSKGKIFKFLMQYLDKLDETVGYVVKTKPAVSGGLTQDKEMFNISVGNAE